MGPRQFLFEGDSMKLIIASNNEHKIREIKEIIGAFFPTICSLKEAGITLEVLEDGKTFKENAVKKAESVLAVASGFDAALADDSGLSVDALHGAPGVYSARYAGEPHCDADNNKKLMEDMRDIPASRRTCRFVSCVALARKGKDTITSTGTVEGLLLNAPMGSNGFGYDPYFYYPPARCSFAQMPSEQKNAVSHRHNALMKMRALLEEER